MRILCLAAHPDDETIGVGGTLARHAAEGADIVLLVATAAYEPRWDTATIETKRAECLAAAERLGQNFAPPPATTAHGALLAHITGGADAATFQPMNVNFGLFPPLTPPAGKRKVKKKDRKPAMSARALADLDAWLATSAEAAE